MPSDGEPRRSRTSRSGEERSRSRRPKDERSSSNKVKDPKDKAVVAADDAKKVVKQVSDAVSSAAGSAADVLGGWHELDKYIKDYNPTFYEFVEKSFLKNISATSTPSKFVVCLIALAIMQSTIPIFAWPLDFAASLLSFVFLYNSGIDELRTGFKNQSETRALKVKTFLTVFLILTALDMIPMFLFDTTYHFGALWKFLLPVLLFVTPGGKSNQKETIAIWIADSVFAQISSVLQSLVPDAFLGSDQMLVYFCGVVLGMMLWTGMLGATGSYMVVFGILGLATVNHVGKTFISPTTSSSGFSSQMTIWHNLLAIWLWRYLVSAIEGIGIPGVVSVLGWIQYHLPSYFLWMTGFFFAMLMTAKTASSGKADTWYARWLTGAPTSPSKESSSGSAAPERSSRSRGSEPSSGERSSSSKSREHRSSRGGR